MSSILAPSPSTKPEVSWNEPVAEVYQSVESMPQGLTTAGAARRLRAFGPDEIGQREHGAFREFLHFLTNPLVLILLFASLVSMVTGDYANASIILVIVVGTYLALVEIAKRWFHRHNQA